MNHEELVARKNAAVLALEAAKESDEVTPLLAKAAAALEQQLGKYWLAQGNAREAATSFISQASCLVDGGEYRAAVRVLRKTKSLRIGSRLTTWIETEIARIDALRSKTAERVPLPVLSRDVARQSATAAAVAQRATSTKLGREFPDRFEFSFFVDDILNALAVEAQRALESGDALRNSQLLRALDEMRHIAAGVQRLLAPTPAHDAASMAQALVIFTYDVLRALENKYRLALIQGDARHARECRKQIEALARLFSWRT